MQLNTILSSKAQTLGNYGKLVICKTPAPLKCRSHTFKCIFPIDYIHRLKIISVTEAINRVAKSPPFVRVIYYSSEFKGTLGKIWLILTFAIIQ